MSIVSLLPAGEDSSVYLYAVTRNQTAVYNLRTNSKVAASSELRRCFR